MKERMYKWINYLNHFITQSTKISNYNKTKKKKKKKKKTESQILKKWFIDIKNKIVSAFW